MPEPAIISVSLNAKGVHEGEDIDAWGLMREFDLLERQSISALAPVAAGIIANTCSCGANMIHTKGGRLQCPQCGMYGAECETTMPAEYSASAADAYNTNESGSIALKVVGRKSYGQARSLRAVLSDYAKVQTNTTRKQFMQYNSMAMSRGSSLPDIVLNDATALYSDVQKSGRVSRSKKRLGAMAACLAIACDSHGISKKPKDIAAFMQIDEKFMSGGDKMLREMHSRGELNIEINHNPCDSFLTQYFNILGVDSKWISCAGAIIGRAAEDDMVGENNSRTSTKCAGVAYLLGRQLNLSFGRDEIAKRCKISHSTFVRYFEYLFTNRKRINPILREYNIPTMHRRVRKN